MAFEASSFNVHEIHTKKTFKSQKEAQPTFHRGCSVVGSSALLEFRLHNYNDDHDNDDHDNDDDDNGHHDNMMIMIT